MKLFNGILGVFSAFAAMFCFCYPGRTFLNAGWIITFLLVCWGACSLFEWATNKIDTKHNKKIVVKSVLAIILGVATGFASAIVIVRPGLSLITDLVVIWAFLLWILISGITEIVSAVKMKKTISGKKWIFVLILGILTLLLGVYGVCHVFLTAWTITMMFGIVLAGYSVRLISSIFE